MNLHLFFEGSIAREPVSSAFLATLLEQRSDVRSAFFDMVSACIGGELTETFKTKAWFVSVEGERVDIRLDAIDGSWVILLENKLQGGSMRKGQLPQYYHEQITREPTKRVLAMYLAPGAGVGESEVVAVRCSERFGERDCDFAARLSWNTIAEFLADVSTNDAEGRFISSGIGSIIKVIEDAATLKFPHVDGREQVYKIACQFRDGLHQSTAGLHFGQPWPEIDSFTLGSHKTNLTLRFVLCFDASSEPPYGPVNLFDGDTMNLTVESRLKFSALGRRNPVQKSRWNELVNEGTVSVPGVGVHHLGDNGWLVLDRRLQQRPDSLLAELVEMAEPLLRFVNRFQ